MVRCEYNEETHQMDMEAHGGYAIAELMFLMEEVTKEIGKQTNTDWKVHLHYMVRVVLEDEMTLEDVAKLADAAINNGKYGVVVPEV